MASQAYIAAASVMSWVTASSSLSTGAPPVESQASEVDDVPECIVIDCVHGETDKYCACEHSDICQFMLASNLIPPWPQPCLMATESPPISPPSPTGSMTVPPPPPCEDGFILDCQGLCAPEHRLGDGVCDGDITFDGPVADSGADFACSAMKFDQGDCIETLSESSLIFDQWLGNGWTLTDENGAGETIPYPIEAGGIQWCMGIELGEGDASVTFSSFVPMGVEGAIHAFVAGDIPLPPNVEPPINAADGNGWKCIETLALHTDNESFQIGIGDYLVIPSQDPNWLEVFIPMETFTGFGALDGAKDIFTRIVFSHNVDMECTLYLSKLMYLMPSAPAPAPAPSISPSPPPTVPPSPSPPPTPSPCEVYKVDTSTDCASIVEDYGCEFYPQTPQNFIDNMVITYVRQICGGSCGICDYQTPTPVPTPAPAPLAPPVGAQSGPDAPGPIAQPSLFGGWPDSEVKLPPPSTSDAPTPPEMDEGGPPPAAFPPPSPPEGDIVLVSDTPPAPTSPSNGLTPPPPPEDDSSSSGASSLGLIIGIVAAAAACLVIGLMLLAVCFRHRIYGQKGLKDVESGKGGSPHWGCFTLSRTSTTSSDDTETKVDTVIGHKETTVGGVESRSYGVTRSASFDGRTTHSPSALERKTSENSPRVCRRWEVDFAELRLGKRVGRGAAGEVFHAFWKGTEVAVKRLWLGDRELSRLEAECNDDEKAAALIGQFGGIPLTSKNANAIYPEASDIVEKFEKEVEILASLRHPNVILFMGACRVSPNICVITEYASRGSLAKLFHEGKCEGQSFDRKTRLRLALHAARGINYLHTHDPKIIHRDIKMENLLVTHNYVVKVCDFGLSCILERNQTHLTKASQVGTAGYMAPEVLRNESYGEKADVWSFGVLLYEILTGKRPYSEHDFALQVMVAVATNGARPKLVDIDSSDSVGKQLVQLVDDCCHQEATHRPRFEEILDRLLAIMRQLSAPQPPPGQTAPTQPQLQPPPQQQTELQPSPPAPAPVQT